MVTHRYLSFVIRPMLVCNCTEKDLTLKAIKIDRAIKCISEALLIHALKKIVPYFEENDGEKYFIYGIEITNSYKFLPRP